MTNAPHRAPFKKGKLTMSMICDTQAEADPRALSSAEVEQVSGGLIFLLAIAGAALLGGCVLPPCPPKEKEQPTKGPLT